MLGAAVNQNCVAITLRFSVINNVKKLTTKKKGKSGEMYAQVTQDVEKCYALTLPLLLCLSPQGDSAPVGGWAECVWRTVTVTITKIGILLLFEKIPK